MGDYADIRLSVLIPCYNEEAGLGAFLSDLKSTLGRLGVEHEILVIDDGSTDKTSDIAHGVDGVKVLRHPINRGYGRSLVTGIENAAYGHVLMLDGDGTYPAAEIEKLLPHARDFDMVIGRRVGAQFWGGPFKAILRMILLRLSRFVTGEDIPDVNSGLRIIKKAVIRDSMPILCYGFSFSTTITLSFLRDGRFVKFVDTQYVERKGSSKVRMLRDMLRTLQLMTQVVVFFNPLKLAVCIALLPLALGAGFAAQAWCTKDPAWAGLAMDGLFMALFCLFGGFLLDALRMHLRSQWRA